MRVLVCELEKVIVESLENRGFTVKTQAEACPVKLCERFLHENLNACVIRIKNNDFGIYTVNALRDRKIAVPVIGIANSPGGNRWSELRADFLEGGGDDLLRAPAHPRELVASLLATIRRSVVLGPDVIMLRSRGVRLTINISTRTVFVNDDLVWLNDDCLAILHCLAAQPGHIVSKEMLHDMIYTDKDGDLPELETITVLVHRLRRKLSPDDPELFIKTIRGSGYCLIEAHVT